MPRKFYAPQNRYCRNANISEEVLLRILWIYLQTGSANDVRREIQNDSRIETSPPSVKTISKYYQMIGEYIYKKTFAEMLGKINASLSNIRRECPEGFNQIVKDVGERWADRCLNEVRYDEYLIISEGQRPNAFYDDYLIELRKSSASRKGLRGDRRGEMALACLRSIISSTDDGYNPADVSPSYVKTMRIFLSIQKWLEADPL